MRNNNNIKPSPANPRKQQQLEIETQLSEITESISSLRIREATLRSQLEEISSKEEYVVGDNVVIIDKKRKQYGIKGTVTKVSSHFVWIETSNLKDHSIIQKKKHLVRHVQSPST